MRITGPCRERKRNAELLAVVLLLTAAVVACVSGVAKPSTRVRVVGSDTMLILNRRLAESFMRGNPGVSVEVRGGGSGSGVAALTAGDAEICAASRPLTAAEVAALYDATGSLGLGTVVARDALSVYLNVDNPLRDVTLEDLRRLFAGRVRNWNELGGADREVQLVVRPPNSGTQRFFRDRVLLGEPYGRGAAVAPRTVDVLRLVRDQVGAVGFGGVAYRAEGVVQCAVDGSRPTSEAVAKGRYPLARYLLYFTIDAPRGATRRYMDWCLGPEGQKIVAEVGYIPLWPAT